MGENEERVPFRSMRILLSENSSISRESLVAGIGGIQPIAEGENVYVCTATNGIAVATISVLINVPGTVVSVSIEGLVTVLLSFHP